MCCHAAYAGVRYDPRFLKMVMYLMIIGTCNRYMEFTEPKSHTRIGKCKKKVQMVRPIQAIQN